MLCLLSAQQHREARTERSIRACPSRSRSPEHATLRLGCSMVAVAQTTKGSLAASLAKLLQKQGEIGAPHRIRTCDPCLRSYRKRFARGLLFLVLEFLVLVGVGAV